MLRKRPANAFGKSLTSVTMTTLTATKCQSVNFIRGKLRSRSPVVCFKILANIAESILPGHWLFHLDALVGMSRGNEKHFRFTNFVVFVFIPVFVEVMDFKPEREMSQSRFFPTSDFLRHCCNGYKRINVRLRYTWDIVNHHMNNLAPNVEVLDFTHISLKRLSTRQNMHFIRVSRINVAWKY